MYTCKIPCGRCVSVCCILAECVYLSYTPDVMIRERETERERERRDFGYACWWALIYVTYLLYLCIILCMLKFWLFFPSSLSFDFNYNIICGCLWGRQLIFFISAKILSFYDFYQWKPFTLRKWTRSRASFFISELWNFFSSLFIFIFALLRCIFTDIL